MQELGYGPYSHVFNRLTIDELAKRKNVQSILKNRYPRDLSIKLFDLILDEVEKPECIDPKIVKDLILG